MADNTTTDVELSPGPGSGALARWTPQQVDIIRRHVAPGCTDPELAFFAEVCRHRDLDPFALEIVGVPRWNKREQRNVMVIQTTVRGERTLAERTGLYGGQDEPQWCGPDGVWRDVWLETAPPAAARVAVYRKDWDRPSVGVARYASYVQLKDGRPTGLWANAPDLMLAKCAEAAALRKAFSRGREFTVAQRISMEARAAGLDDDGRHTLINDVTDGRSSSSRHLTDEDALEVRAEISRLAAETRADPETGEIPDPDDHHDDDGADPDELERRRLAADLRPRARALTGDTRAEFIAWLDQSGIGAAKPVKDYTLDELRTVEEWLRIRDDMAEEPF